MDIKKFSWNNISSRIVATCQRFPLTIAFLALLMLSMIASNHKYISDEQYVFFCAYYFSTGALLSLALRLWSEEISNGNKALATQIVIHILWFCSALYLVNSWPLDIVHGYAIMGAVLSLIAATLLVSFFREKTDLPLWNFLQRIIFGLVLSLCIGTILSMGLCLLFYSFNMLFGLKISEIMYIDIYCVCYFFITPVIFIQYIPAEEEEHNSDNAGLSRIMNGIVHYLFVPLLAAYILTLYAYMVKILFTWTLPCGWVSWLVTSMMIGMLVIMMLVYPSRFHEERRFDHLLMRWLPIISLPPLVLMTIGIVRRLSDYGITIDRLYLALFNIWCYAVCICLVLKSRKRIWWIPASFAIAALLSSVGPQSFANITRASMTRDIKQSMESAGIKDFPIDKKTCKKWVQGLTADEDRRLYDKVEYLYYTYEFDYVRLEIGNVELHDFKYPGPSYGRITTYESDDMLTDIFDMPKGYSKMVIPGRYFDIINHDKGVVTLLVEYKDNDEMKKQTFKIKESVLETLKKDKDDVQPLTMKNDSAMLYINHISVNVPIENGSNYNFDGILFLR